MEKPTNGYYVLIKNIPSREIVEIRGPFSSWEQTEQVETELDVSLEYNKQQAYGAWFGPDIQPTEQS